MITFFKMCLLRLKVKMKLSDEISDKIKLMAKNI